MEEELTEKKLISVLSAFAIKSNALLYSPYLVTYCKQFKINTKLRLCHFLAQVLTESGNLKFVTELGGKSYFEKYDTGRLAKNLGNTPQADGDGYKYRGRGLIQVTGKANYTAFAKWSHLDIVTHPEIVASSPEVAVLSAIWFWATHNLNTLADADNIDRITKVINGGSNGIETRKENLHKLKNLL